MVDQDNSAAAREEQSSEGLDEAINTQAEAESGESVEESDLHAMLEDARNRADEHWDQCLRLQAEIENLRKRSARELENAHKFGLEKFASGLLPVKDSLEMGLLALQGEVADPDKLKEGSELTLKMLGGVMEKFGIVEINPEGERFNPEFHEAMSMQERADVEPNTIITVVQKGYLLNDRLIRPAMVIVSRGNSTPSVDERA